MSGAISLALVHELVDYNYWARDRQLEACEALSEEQFLRPMGGSFSSIRDHLAHMVAVEWLWLERWRGRSAAGLLPAAEFPTLASICERWRAVEGEMRAFLATLDEEALGRPFTYRKLNGDVCTYTQWRMLMHTLNHQTFHRGQVSTLLRQVGITPPGVDFLIAHDLGIGIR